MSNDNVLVTGGSGFIGSHLVKQLVASGKSVTCLVRKTSNTTELKLLGCQFVYGDIVGDTSVLESAVRGQQVVYHLAANTKALTNRERMKVNVDGVANLLTACRNCETPPTVVLVSSLAASGPSSISRPHFESDPCRPVSQYGASKAKAEWLARQYGSQVPVTIVRPPIVLGAGDRDGLALFKSINNNGVHVVPGFRDSFVSIVHADDLVNAMMLAADNGKRISHNDSAQGVYFVAADEILSYSELGEMIGHLLGRDHTRIMKVPYALLWTLASFNSASGYFLRSPRYLNLDKAREITAGSWTCSNSKIISELGFAPAFSLAERLRQTAHWYRTHGWLKSIGRDVADQPTIADKRNSATNRDFICD